MWLKNKKYSIRTNFHPDEIKKRLKGITEEPEDISKVVPLDIYRFRGNVSDESIKLKVNWAYKVPLHLDVTFSKSAPVKINITRFFPKNYKIMNLLFVFAFLLLIIDWAQKSLFGAIIILLFWIILMPILTWFNSVIEKKKIYKIFNYINSDNFKYEKTKYSHS